MQHCRVLIGKGVEDQQKLNAGLQFQSNAIVYWGCGEQLTGWEDLGQGCPLQ